MGNPFSWYERTIVTDKAIRENGFARERERFKRMTNTPNTKTNQIARENTRCKRVVSEQLDSIRVFLGSDGIQLTKEQAGFICVCLDITFWEGSLLK